MHQQCGLAIVITALLAAAPLLAQNAELSGLITDPSGLAVPGARVVVQSADTGASRTVSSNQRGEYSVPALLPGPYNITIDATGFKTIYQNGVGVEVDQRPRLDFALTVGSTTETVTVEGNASPLNTADASVSTLIGNQFVEDLPLNGRSFSSLIDLAPGVVLIPANQYEGGPVQREWPASGCELFHGRWSQRQPGEQCHQLGTKRGWPASGHQLVWRDQ